MTVPDRAAASVPPWLEALFASPPVDPQRLRWGFTNESWAVTVDGRRLVATRMAGPARVARILDRGPELARRLSTAGVPTPVAVAAASRPEAGILVSEFLEGTPAIELLGSRDGPRLVGAIAGEVWRRLHAIDPSGLALDDRWTRRAELVEWAEHALTAWSARTSSATIAAVGDALGEVGRLLEGRRSGFVHGDLVPVNLLVRDVRLAALLDLEAAHLGEPLLDAAWFGWIVRFHHPAVWPSSWAGFATAAEIDQDDSTTRLLALLPVVRILELLVAAASTPSHAARWLEQLEAWAAAH